MPGSGKPREAHAKNVKQSQLFQSENPLLPLPISNMNKRLLQLFIITPLFSASLVLLPKGAACAASTSPAAPWVLNTFDTKLTLSIVGDRPAIKRFEGSEVGWNWTPHAAILPLLTTVYMGGTQYTPDWKYETATVDTSKGTKVTLTFTSTAPRLTLTQIWWASTGAGPVEQTTSVTNNSGTDITYNDADVIATDLTVVSDKIVTLWRFNRSSVSYEQDPGFTTGVFKQELGPNTSVVSTFSNHLFPGPFVLPFVMIDVGADHGIYIGYESDFGQLTTSTTANEHQVRNLFQLWTSNDFTQAPGTTLSLPSVFYGAYKGNTDVGSNRMKAWFWANKMTPTIKNTPEEPLVEADCSLNSESNFRTVTPGVVDLENWGVELLKQDAPWTKDVDTDPLFGWSWSPNPAYWPQGMTLGKIAHDHHMKLSLYMANRYSHVNLATKAGVAAEEEAAESRFIGTAPGWVGPGFDYWRSDIEFEPTADYLSHLGFMEVMDYMISKHPNFRWENCSGGGSKKSFDLAQRMSFCVAEDSGLSAGSLTHFRQSYYAMSYMFNPVQIGEQNADFMDNTEAAGLLNFRTGFFGAWLWGMQAGGWAGNKQYPLYVALYKAKQRAILRGADVYHILPMPDGINWDGIELFNPATNKGSVILLKPGVHVGASPRIILQGLIPTTIYSLIFQDRSSLNASYAHVSGNALMTTGIDPISGTNSGVDSEIIWINY